MKKFKRFCYRILPVALCAAMLGGCGASAASSSAAESIVSTDSAPLKVMASFYPMYDFAQKIGGDKVTVTNMVPAGIEPHDWEPPQPILPIWKMPTCSFTAARAWSIGSILFWAA